MEKWLTGTFTSRITWNRSKLCTKTWEKQLWSPCDFLSSISEPQVPHRGDRVITDRAPQPYWLPGHGGLLPGKDSWSMHLSSNREHFLRLDMEYSISDCKKEPFSEPGLAKRCQGSRSSWPLELGVLCPLQWAWWFVPCELAESYLPRAQHSSGPPANWSVSAPDQPGAASAVTRA